MKNKFVTSFTENIIYNNIYVKDGKPFKNVHKSSKHIEWEIGIRGGTQTTDMIYFGIIGIK